jgi:YVTN family beta-propeller protein
VGATFGDVISLGGTPSDIVLDELRHRLYLVNSNANRIDVYDYEAKQVAGQIPVGTMPIAAAMSMDGAYLYVSNNSNASLSVISLANNSVVQTVSLPARPEGVEVGDDGRVLITTQGTGTNNAQNTLLLFDRNQQLAQQVLPVTFPPPPPTPTQLPQIQLGRALTTFRGKLIRTPDGKFIVGLTTFNNNATTYVFVYETASGTILRSRQVGGQSTVLSMGPDGARFMAGFTLYDTATLAVVGQQNTANAPFVISATNNTFSTLQNVGGSTFSPDGETLYSAFNTAAFTQPAPRPQSSVLLISNPRNLFIKLGIKIPESIIARMVITSDGASAWGLSESGLIHLPLSTLYDYPIIMPESNTVFLAQDECNKGISRGALRINNIGTGKLTFNVPNTGAALVTQVSSGVAPSTITFVMESGRAGVIRQPGTNLYTGGGATNSGTPVSVDLVSREAINIPNRIRVYMNFRQPDQRGMIYPLPTVINNNEGLWDMLLDEQRGRLYITNSGFNRLDVFDTKKLRFLEPIELGQLPHQMAMASDGTTLYVGNSGGESISIVDLELGRVIGGIDFPPVPRNATANPIFPQAIAMGLSGLQIIMSNGTLWKVVGNEAIPRQPSQAIGVTAQGQQTVLGAPRYMLSTAGGEYIIALGAQGANGLGYLYDALVDNYTSSRVLFTTPVQSYYGPLGAATGSYFLANGLILNPALTVIGGAERPGAVTVTPPPAPNQPPTQTVVSAGQRNVAAVASIDENTFIRLTTPVRNNVNVTQTRDDLRPTIEMVDLRTGAESLAGVAPENPNFSVFGTQRINIPPRQMVVDSAGNAYAITLSGLSVISLTATGTNSRPRINAGSGGIINSNDGTPNFRPGSFITIRGINLSSPAAADQVPLPTVLGGSCVVFNDIPLPLIEASPTQISAQIPETVRAGTNVVQVRSLATAQNSDPIVVTVQRLQ